MPDPNRIPEDQIEAWITVGGKKVPLEHGEEKDMQIKHRLTSVGGEKTKETSTASGAKQKTEEPRSEKETKKSDDYATSDSGTVLPVGDKVKVKKVGYEPETPEKGDVGDWYRGWERMLGNANPCPTEYQNLAETRKSEQRHGLMKTPFKSRDLVFYDNMQKAGLVAGIEGNHIRIFTKDKNIVTLHKDYVYKADEMTKYGHWDAMNNKTRLDLLKEHNMNTEYSTTDWSFLPEPMRKILKAMGPAGYEGAGINTVSRGVYNPVTQDKTLAQRLKDEKERNTEKKSGGY